MVNPVNTGAGGAYAAQLGRKSGADEAGKAGASSNASKALPPELAKLVDGELGADGAAAAAKEAGAQIGEQAQGLANADPRSLMKLFDV